MILNMKFLPLFATTSLILSIAVSGEGQLRSIRNLQDPNVPRVLEESDTDPCLEFYGSGKRDVCTTLEELVTELKTIVPQKGDPYNRPMTITLEDWKGVIREMLEGKCRNIDLNNYPQLNGRYKLYYFEDTKMSKPKYYCVFAATSTNTPHPTYDRAQFAWGTFITRIRQPDEDVRIFNLSIDVPHPYSDLGTYEQGVQIYKHSQARSMYLAGAHREADSDESDCGEYNKADASHNYQNALTSTTMAVKKYWESKSRDFAVIQIHGKATDTCEYSDVFVADGAANTYGDMQNPNPIVEKFRENLEEEIHHAPVDGFYSVDTFSSHSGCPLGATKNIQARVLNGMEGKDDICNFKKDGTGKFFDNPNGTFLQIEQSKKVRDDGSLPKLFGNAIRRTFDNPKYYRTSTTDQSLASLAKSNNEDTSSVDDADDVPAATSTNASGASSFLASVAVVPAAATVVATIAGTIML